MFDRLPTPFGLVRAGRRARPPEDQVGDPRLREDRGPRRLPLLRQRRGRPRRHRRRARASATTRSSTPTARRPTASSASPARTCPARTRPPSSSTGTTPTPTSPTTSSTSPAERAVVIGNGNVAADVARMLALPRDELEITDTADHAIEALAELGVEEIVVLGRRGPGAGRVHQPRGARARRARPTPTSSSTRPRSSSTRPAAPTSSPRTATRPTAATSRSSPSSPSREPEGKPKRVVLRFCCSPVEIKGDGRVERIVIGRNELYARRVGRDPRPRHRRARGDRVRPGAALDRLQGRRPRGHPVRRRRAA